MGASRKNAKKKAKNRAHAETRRKAREHVASFTASGVTERNRNAGAPQRPLTAR
jgi:hypothetical protein